MGYDLEYRVSLFHGGRDHLWYFAAVLGTWSHNHHYRVCVEFGSYAGEYFGQR
jgi:hypothetical protein